jgi:hypothetical protein
MPHAGGLPVGDPLGRGRIIGYDHGQYLVRIITGLSLNQELRLTEEEILTDTTIKTEGRIVLRDNGFYVSYHLIPD